VPLSRFGPAFTIAFALVVAGPPALADEPTKQECVAANESAQDLQRASKLVEAREHLRVCAAKACPRAVRVDCAERLDAIEKALPTVVLTPRDAGGGAELGSATLAIDGATLPEPLNGTPVSVDPGTHTFTVSLAGRSPVSLRLSLNEGDAVRREVVLRAPRMLAGKMAPDSDALAAGPEGQQAAPPGAIAEGSETPTNTLRLAGWSALGVGAAGVTLASIFGILGLEKKAWLSKTCPDPDGKCKPASPAEGQAIQTNIDGVHFDGAAGDISLLVGVLGLGAGGTLLYLASENHAPDAARPRSASLHAKLHARLNARAWVGLGDVGVAGSFP